MTTHERRAADVAMLQQVEARRGAMLSQPAQAIIAELEVEVTRLRHELQGALSKREHLNFVTLGAIDGLSSLLKSTGLAQVEHLEAQVAELMARAERAEATMIDENAGLRDLASSLIAARNETAVKADRARRWAARWKRTAKKYRADSFEIASDYQEVGELWGEAESRAERAEQERDAAIGDPSQTELERRALEFELGDLLGVIANETGCAFDGDEEDYIVGCNAVRDLKARMERAGARVILWKRKALRLRQERDGWAKQCVERIVRLGTAERERDLLAYLHMGGSVGAVMGALGLPDGLDTQDWSRLLESWRARGEALVKGEQDGNLR